MELALGPPCPGRPLVPGRIDAPPQLRTPLPPSAPTPSKPPSPRCEGGHRSASDFHVRAQCPTLRFLPGYRLSPPRPVSLASALSLAGVGTCEGQVADVRLRRGRAGGAAPSRTGGVTVGHGEDCCLLTRHPPPPLALMHPPDTRSHAPCTRGSTTPAWNDMSKPRCMLLPGRTLPSAMRPRIRRLALVFPRCDRPPHPRAFAPWRHPGDLLPTPLQPLPSLTPDSRFLTSHLRL